MAGLCHPGQLSTAMPSSIGPLVPVQREAPCGFAEQHRGDGISRVALGLDGLGLPHDPAIVWLGIVHRPGLGCRGPYRA